MARAYLARVRGGHSLDLYLGSNAFSTPPRRVPWGKKRSFSEIFKSEVKAPHQHHTDAFRVKKRIKAPQRSHPRVRARRGKNNTFRGTAWGIFNGFVTKRPKSRKARISARKYAFRPSYLGNGHAYPSFPSAIRPCLYILCAATTQSAPTGQGTYKHTDEWGPRTDALPLPETVFRNGSLSHF